MNPDPTAEEAARLSGIQVVLTTQMTAGSCLIADSHRAMRLFVREGIRCAWAHPNADDFVTNQAAFLAEERITLGVLRPTAIAVVTGS
ncbi:phage major capsid protein [Gordonia rhizosphera]|uniref:Phage capsid-like C-terminal domain-containing protein n=1 Tax=Gordonia rhizosphera NBRC 16068 TaxID=1108045 RepID=K6WAG8_9ACTN|nr:phage major capsid protein [Gordonia rhizosphera]GAB89197.1 hypothetical protein GORHZ_053_00500 [Gordonia rhizosphera NBRC 16068]